MDPCDVRRSPPRQRGAAILEQVRMRQSLCLRTLGGDRAGEERAGRFFANPSVTTGRIIESWSEHTGKAVAGRHVLAIQDTSDVTFRTRPDQERGLGLISDKTRGVLVHAMLEVEAASGACLGLVGGAVWNRPGLVETHHNERPLSARESRRWVETAETAKGVLAEAAMVTVLADRESDLFALWARVPRPDFHLLSRVQVDRKLALPTGAPTKNPPTLFSVAEGFPARGGRTLDLASRGPGRARRSATVELRFGPVSIRRPRLEHDKTLAETVALSLVEAREIDPPAGEEAVHRRLMKLTATAVKAACLDMQLVQERDGLHGLAAKVAFSEAEIDTIELLVPGLEGRTERQRNPHPPRGLARASWVMARLGGVELLLWPARPYRHPPRRRTLPGHP